MAIGTQITPLPQPQQVLNAGGPQQPLHQHPLTNNNTLVNTPVFCMPRQLQTICSRTSAEVSHTPPRITDFTCLPDTVATVAAECLHFQHPTIAFKWQANNIIYTDGSQQGTIEHGIVIGGGVCRPREPSAAAYVLPCGVGPTNTINRAELAALAHATQHTCKDSNSSEVIATDSLCSLYQIRKAVYNPKGLMASKHYAIAWDIADHLRRRAQHRLHTTLIKVKSHSGVKGNEMADRLAKQACRMTLADSNTYSVSIGCTPYDNKYWIGKREPDRNNEIFFLDDISAGVMRHALSTECCYGGSNKSIYAQLLKEQMAKSAAAHSNHFWTLYQNKVISFMHVSNILRIRTGTLWTAKLAAKFHMTYGNSYAQRKSNAANDANVTHNSSDACPLCGQPDSPAHILGYCSSHKALHIQRHDTTGRVIIQHIRKGKLGGCYIMADVGCPEKLRALGVHDKRIPAWLIPQHNNMLSRADVLVVHIPIDKDDLDTPMLPAGTKITIVEVGYRNDFDLDGKKRAEKLAQHANLQQELQQRGFDVDYQVWDIGFTGILPDTLMAQATRLGIADPDALLHQIHQIAVEHAKFIVMERRAMEKLPQAPQSASAPVKATHLRLRRKRKPP
jgi:ribonuclease HI